MVKIDLCELKKELTDDEVLELKDAESKEDVFEQDCPEMNKDQLSQFRPIRLSF